MNVLFQSQRVKKNFMNKRLSERNPVFATNFGEALDAAFPSHHRFVELARARGEAVTDSDVTLYRRGIMPNPRRLMLFADMLGVSIDWLLRGRRLGEQRVQDLSAAAQSLLGRVEGLTDEQQRLLQRCAEVLRSDEEDLIETLAHVVALCERLVQVRQRDEP